MNNKDDFEDPTVIILNSDDIESCERYYKQPTRPLFPSEEDRASGLKIIHGPTRKEIIHSLLYQNQPVSFKVNDKLILTGNIIFIDCEFFRLKGYNYWLNLYLQTDNKTVWEISYNTRSKRGRDLKQIGNIYY